MSYKVILNQSYDYALLKLKQNLRGNKLKTGIGLVFFSVYCAVAGIILVILFLFSSIKTNTNPGLTFRSLFANSILMFYLIVIIYTFLSSAFGVSNPFLKNRSDLIFQLLVPVNPFVSYFSVKIYSMIRDIFLTSLGCLLLFGPLMITLNKSTYAIRLVLVDINFFLGIEILLLSGNFIYFLLQRIRKGKNWEVVFAEQSIVFIGLICAIPLFFFYMFYIHQLLSFQILLNLSFLPIINIATGNVGFFFRSGIPFYSYMSLIYSLLQIVLLLALNIIFIQKSFSTAELGQLLPVLEFFQNQRAMTLSTFRDHPIPDIDKVKSNANFYNKRTIVPLIKKEWLLIKRVSSLKTNFIAVWILAVVVFVLNVFKIRLDPFIFSFSEYYLALPIALEIGCLVTMYQSIKSNDKIVSVPRRKNLYVKLLSTLVFISPFYLLMILKINLFVIIFLLALIIIAEIYNRININSFYLNYLTAIFMVPFFIIIFLPYVS